MNCNQFAKYITDYVDGALEKGVAGEMESHMSLCRDCRSLVTELENTSSLIRSLDRLAAPEGFEARLRSRITSVPARGEKKVLRERLFGRPHFLRPVLAALAVCLLIVGSALTLTHRARDGRNAMDWEYIEKCRSEHATFASANPLADDSAVILGERARDLGGQL